MKGTTMVPERLQRILQRMIAVEQDLTPLDQEDLVWLRAQFEARDGTVAHAFETNLAFLALTREPLPPEEIQELKGDVDSFREESSDRLEDKLPMTALA